MDNTDIYCKICSGCGEDGCCPASMCTQSKDGLYCENYLQELKFGYFMYSDIVEKLDIDKEALDKIFEENYNLIFGENKNIK